MADGGILPLSSREEVLDHSDTIGRVKAWFAPGRVAAGFDAHLAKPLDITELIKTIEARPKSLGARDRARS